MDKIKKSLWKRGTRGWYRVCGPVEDIEMLEKLQVSLLAENPEAKFKILKNGESPNKPPAGACADPKNTHGPKQNTDLSSFGFKEEEVERLDTVKEFQTLDSMSTQRSHFIMSRSARKQRNARNSQTRVNRLVTDVEDNAVREKRVKDYEESK